MRRKHRLDGERADELEHLGGAEARALERGERVLHAARLRLFAVLEEVFAAPADAVDALREVHRLKPGGEGAHHIARRGRRAPAHPRGELGARLPLAGARPDRGAPVALDELEERVAPLLAQDLPDQRAEGVHVRAQRLVLGREMDVVAVHPR